MASESKADESSHLTYCVAVDGSDAAHGAFLAVVSLYNKGDRVVVLHISDPAKDYLVSKYRPDAIEERYSTECVGRYPSDAYEIATVKKKPGQSTHDAVCDFVNDRADIDVLAVGIVGRKGPKEDAKLLGSTADYSLRGAHCTSVISKLHDIPDAPVYVIGVDGSDAAHHSLERAQSMANPASRIVVIHVIDAARQATFAEAAKAEAVEARYTEYCKTDSRLSFKTVESDPSKTLATHICDVAEAEGATFLVVGVDGMAAYASGHSTIGSTTDAVVRMCRCNVICPQPRGKSYVFSPRGSK